MRKSEIKREYGKPISEAKCNNIDEVIKNFPLVTEFRQEFLKAINTWVERIIKYEIINRGFLLEKGDIFYVPFDYYTKYFNIELSEILGDRKESLEKEINLSVKTKLSENKIMISVVSDPINSYRIIIEGFGELCLTGHRVSVDLDFFE